MKTLASVVTEVDSFTLIQHDDGSISVPQAVTDDPLKFFIIVAFTRVRDVVKAKKQYESDDMKIKISRSDTVFNASLLDERDRVIFSATVTVCDKSFTPFKSFFDKLPAAFKNMNILS